MQCFIQVHDWKNAENWIEMFNKLEQSTNGITSSRTISNQQIQHLKALSSFDTDDMRHFSDIIDWDHDQRTIRTESMLAVALRRRNENGRNQSMR
jgi:hypothetical protein